MLIQLKEDGHQQILYYETDHDCNLKTGVEGDKDTLEY